MGQTIIINGSSYLQGAPVALVRKLQREFPGMKIVAGLVSGRGGRRNVRMEKKNAAASLSIKEGDGTQEIHLMYPGISETDVIGCIRKVARKEGIPLSE